MGIPVLTSPNNLYAGAISSAIIENLGYESWINESQDELPSMAYKIASNYHSPRSRFKLASDVRASKLCDPSFIPQVFSGEILKMYRIKSSVCG